MTIICSNGRCAADGVVVTGLPPLFRFHMLDAFFPDSSNTPDQLVAGNCQANPV